jgi:hypothetical protein
MDRVLALVTIVLAALVAVSIVRIPQGRGRRLAQIVLPLSTAVLLIHLALSTWSVGAFALITLMLVSAAALAVRAGSPTDRAPWVALGAFAIAATVGGFGMLAQGLCAAGGGYGCGGTVSAVFALVGWTAAVASYGYLYWGALRP